jgi:hypothetical protein
MINLEGIQGFSFCFNFFFSSLYLRLSDRVVFVSKNLEQYDLWEYSSTGYIRFDTGLLEINAYIHDDKKQTSDYKTIYLDFASGEVQEIHLENRGDTGYIVMPEQYYIGENFAAFITHDLDRSNYINNQNHINKLALNP